MTNGQVIVTTAVDLRDVQKEKVRTMLSDIRGYKTLNIQYLTDEAIIGGVVIQIGDRVIDGSLRTKLYHLSQELRNIQL